MFFAAATTVASFTSPTAARMAARGVITAAAGQINHGGDRCISFGGMRVDRAVGAEVIERLQPLGIEAALAAAETQHLENTEKRRQVEFALEQARFEAARARRQYDAVDPDNRLVVASLSDDGTSVSPRCVFWKTNTMLSR